jgi:polygalacturonase
MGASANAQQITVSPQLPAIPAGTYYVTNYGAVADGIFTNTTGIQAAINDACVTNSGGTVVLPVMAGTSNVYLSGPIFIRSYLNLQVDTNVTLRMLPYGSYSGGNFIADGSTANHDIEISGSGTIDGQATSAGWWNGLSTSARPYLLQFYHGAQIWVRDVTLKNPPKMHISFSGASCTNITVQNLTINTPTSPNTDGIDVAGHNILIKDSSIACGDDNVAVTANCSDIIITNCHFGIGHGTSIGGSTSPGGVSNMMVINCTYDGTQNPIRIKSDNNNGVGGGPCQNLQYLNLGMTNVPNAAIMIYAYYNEVSTPTSISPASAAGQIVNVLFGTPSYQRIIISNVTATVSGNTIAGIIWGRTELPCTNILLSNIKITAAKTFDVYNAYGVQFLNCAITNTTSSQKTLTLWNAGVTVSNSISGMAGGVITVDGTNNNCGINLFALYNSQAAMTVTNVFAVNPITLGGGTLTVSNNLFLSKSVALNFVLGTSNSQVAVTGNLTLNSTINVVKGAGFGPGTNILFTYNAAGTLSGTPVLGATPGRWVCSIDTNTAGQVKLAVQLPSSNASPTANPATYNRGAGSPLQIPLSLLAGNWNDPDGDPVTLTGINSSTNGVTPISDGTYINYTNANNVNDQFTYTIADEYGGTGTGVVNIVYTNSPPVANPATYYRVSGYPLHIAIANLQTNWNDPDGNSTTLATVLTSTNGVTPAFDGTYINYTNANNVNDQFGYTIGDGNGGSGAGLVSIVVTPPPTSTITGANLNGDGSVALKFSGVPGYTYRVMSTTNLAPPVNWQPIGTNLAAPDDGSWQFTDTGATNYPQRFYRSVYP